MVLLTPYGYVTRNTRAITITSFQTWFLLVFNASMIPMDSVVLAYYGSLDSKR